jgi:hypothetical protein
MTIITCYFSKKSLTRSTWNDGIVAILAWSSGR